MFESDVIIVSEIEILLDLRRCGVVLLICAFFLSDNV